jgi:hypothetical protein
MKEGFKRYANAKPLKFALIDSKLVSARSGEECGDATEAY